MCVGGVGRVETSRRIAGAIPATSGRGPNRRLKINECASRLLPLSCVSTKYSSCFKVGCVRKSMEHSFQQKHECTRLRLRTAGGKLAARIGASDQMIYLFMFRKLSFELAALIVSFLAGCSTVESR